MINVSHDGTCRALLTFDSMMVPSGSVTRAFQYTVIAFGSTRFTIRLTTLSGLLASIVSTNEPSAVALREINNVNNNGRAVNGSPRAVNVKRGVIVGSTGPGGPSTVSDCACTDAAAANRHSANHGDSRTANRNRAMSNGSSGRFVDARVIGVIRLGDSRIVGNFIGDVVGIGLRLGHC